MRLLHVLLGLLLIDSGSQERPIPRIQIASTCAASVLLLFLVGARPARTPTPPAEEEGYLPGPAASRIVSVSATGPVAASIVVQTQAVAVKETGPKETVRAFGEVYSFSPSFFTVHREEPTLVTFWNLQPDDLHDFLLMDPQYDVLMNLMLPPLKKTAWVMTFHREGLFRFYCAAHPPEMAGQILVLAPVAQASERRPTLRRRR